METGLVTVTLFTVMIPSFIETKIQEDSVPVNNFFKFLFSGVNFVGINLFRDGIEISPEFADFDGSFHTSVNTLTDF